MSEHESEFPLIIPSSFSVKLISLKFKINDIILKNNIILTYEVENKKIIKFKSPFTAKVSKILKSTSDKIMPGDPLALVILGCPHPTLFLDICAICGEEVRTSLEEMDSSLATDESFEQKYLPFVHSIPELRVNQEHGHLLGKADEIRLLADNKLVLVVDLDHTLVHTTNDPLPENMKNVQHYQLWGTSSLWYHTKVRPGTKHFLKRMSELFELHICTFGARAYAHTIANILDSDGSLFSHRILSREEFIDSNAKTANLKALFPCGESLVCIIDDREDVWNFIKNVIHVKPYRYFEHTGDINDPSAKSGSSIANNTNESNSKECNEIEVIYLDSEDESKKDIDNEYGVNSKYADHDDYLFYLEEILVKIHQSYFEEYNKSLSYNDKIPQTKNIINQIRSNVLKGVKIVFSGVYPRNARLETVKERNLSLSLGAAISEEIDPLTTTHLIAALSGTNKVHQARKYPNIWIVTPTWLWNCYERWERVSELLFQLPELSQANVQNTVSKTNRSDWKLKPIDETEFPVCVSFSSEISKLKKIKYSNF